MALLDRLTGQPGAILNAHTLKAGQGLQARGHFTKAQIYTVLGLDTSDDAQWDSIQTWLTTSNVSNSLLRYSILDIVAIAFESGYITKAQAQSILEAEGAI